jgi:hypothetical protein
MDRKPSSDEIGTRPISRVLPSAQPIMIGRRRCWSSQTPAKIAITRTGTNFSALSTPTWNAEAFSVMIATSGIVNWVIWLPIWETVSPANSLAKSRLDRTPPGLGAGWLVAGCVAAGWAI